ENFASFKRALAAYTAMGFGVAIDDVGTRHSNLETVMSLRPHFIKISDVLVRGIARSTVKREMLRSLRHIAETIDAVMIAEGIERLDDVVALRDLGLRYGQGYYMARPGQGFPLVPDDIRSQLRKVTPASDPALVSGDEDDDDDERDLPISIALGSSRRALAGAAVRSPFGRDDEVTRDFQVPRPPEGESPAGSGVRPVPPAWRPLTDDEIGATPEAEPLLDSLRRARAETASDDDGGGGRPGLN
ncbi:MAG TPA: EAL domain-containing protein, partial [Kofleriaceae bacterium]|nr:EAL domain-containing protein [Kofleriaceae bacterium]